MPSVHVHVARGPAWQRLTAMFCAGSAAFAVTAGLMARLPGPSATNFMLVTFMIATLLVLGHTFPLLTGVVGGVMIDAGSRRDRLPI